MGSVMFTRVEMMDDERKVNVPKHFERQIAKI
jgi:hypothetical protein